MEIKPILKALLRNKLGALLVAAQIAVTLTVLCNGAFIAWQRFEHMSRPTGMDVENVFAISSNGLGENYPHLAAMQQDLETIRSLPGVVAATSTNAIPLSGGGWGEGLKTDPNPDLPSTNGNLYFIDEQGLDALGVTLAAGRGFDTDDMLIREIGESTMPDVVIITQAFADALFPDGGALGQTVYTNGLPIRIIGIVERMQGAWLGWDGVERVMLLPGRLVGNNFSRYLIRAEAGERDRVMAEVEEAMVQLDGNRIVRANRSLEDYRAGSYATDRAVAVTLMVVIGLLMVITGLGIVGLVSFLVSQRTKQVGTRRALGAQRFQVVRYFLVENWLITTTGLSIGLFMTVGLNAWMAESLEMTKLDWR